MKELIKLVNINQEYRNEKILTNINLSFNKMQNTVIYADDNQIQSCHLLLDIIAKVSLPQRGQVQYFDDKSSKFFVGYNLFNSILEKDVIVLNVIKALTSSHDIAKKEADELLKILTIDNFITKSVIDLTEQEKQLLNTYLLLLVKPQVILLKSLSISGSDMMQAAAFGYIKNYLSKYKMTLIITTNDKNTINSICERGINLSNTIVESDVLILQSNQFYDNSTNIKSQAFDFTEDLLESIYKLEEKNIDLDGSRNDEKQFVEKILTKSLSNNEPDTYIPTTALNSELESIIEEKKAIQKMDIQNNSNIEVNITKTVKLMNNPEIDIKQLHDLYHQKHDLEEQYNSLNFTNLSVDLQSKVYENHARVNSLINKYDPTGKHDPYYKPAFNDALEQERMEKPVYKSQVGITKMIFDENLDIDSLDILDDESGVVNKTKEISIAKPNYEDVKTKVYNVDELTKKITSASDIEYMPDDNKKRFWFNKKKNHEESTAMRYVTAENNENMTHEFLEKNKKQSPARVVKTEKFEPTKKLLNVEVANFNAPDKRDDTSLTKDQKKKQIVELKIKKRSKLNALEELYYEALEEKENILK